MPAESILGGINQEDTQLELLGEAILLLSAILEKMPRVSGNDQAAVTIEGGSVGISASQTLAAVTTVTTVTTVGTLNNMAAIGGKFVMADNLNFGGVQHIYNNIIVS